MDSRRAQTLEALDAFITKQKALIARTQTDLETLRRLKSEAVADAATSSVVDVGTLADQLSGSAFRLTEQADCAPHVPENIHWDLFAHKDPMPLKNFAKAARTAYDNRNIPNPIPRSDISELQKFVREARHTTLDPMLSRIKYEDEEPKPPASPEISAHAHRMPPRGPSGLFTRRTVQADSPDDVSTSTTVVGSVSAPSSTRWHSPPSPVFEDREEEEKALPMALAKPVRARRISTKLQHQNEERSAVPSVRTRRSTVTAGEAAAAPQPDTPDPEPARPRIMLIIPARKPKPQPEPEATLDVESQSATPSPPPKRLRRSSRCKPSPATPEPLLADETEESDSALDSEVSEDLDPEPEDPPTEPEPEPDPEPEPPIVLGKRKREKKTKLKPDTYKVSWSASEQNLLERLLEQIPVGDPRRYLKISNAMDGRRTPRQVSSRVQKYMQKLKKFGLA